VSKRKSKRPSAGFNPIAKAVSGAAPLNKGDDGYTQALKIRAHAAALAFANGTGTQSDAHILAAAFNVTALLVAEHGHGQEHRGLLPPWRDAVTNLYQRSDGRGGIGEMAAVSAGLELHDALLDTVTLSEMTAVLGRLKAFMLAGLLMEVPRD